MERSDSENHCEIQPYQPHFRSLKGFRHSSRIEHVMTRCGRFDCDSCYFPIGPISPISSITHHARPSPNRRNSMENPRPIIIHIFFPLCQCLRDRGTYERTTCRTLQENRTIPTGFIGSGASVLGPARPGKQLATRLCPARHYGIQTVHLPRRCGRTPRLALRGRRSSLAPASHLLRKLLESILP